jgi:hypothetical protein
MLSEEVKQMILENPTSINLGLVSAAILECDYQLPRDHVDFLMKLKSKIFADEYLKTASNYDVVQSFENILIGIREDEKLKAILFSKSDEIDKMISKAKDYRHSILNKAQKLKSDKRNIKNKIRKFRRMFEEVFPNINAVDFEKSNIEDN